MIYVGIFLIAVILGIALISTKKCIVAGKVLLNIAVLAAIAVVTFMGALMLAFSTVRANTYSIFLLVFAITVAVLLSCLIWGIIKKKYIYFPIICILVLTVISFGGYKIYEINEDKIPTVGESENLLAEYAPYIENTKAVSLNEEATLIINSDIPKLDGATALYPIYSAFAKAVYPKEMIDNIAVRQGNTTNISENEYLTCSKTTAAYEKIVSGDADIIFVAAPSKKQKEFAIQQGVDLVYTPIGKEAFVFFVNAKNPIENISLAEIRQIYSGEITMWDKLGINLGEIRAFQRDEGSGSQSALQRLMEGKELITPPTTDVIGGMGGIIKQTADYKNYKNALGFSFRFYSTEMVRNNQIKLLSIDGVYPNTDNIENNTYPIASDFYAVTRADARENTKLFVEWVLSEQGQAIIKLTGYTPLRK